MQKKRIRKPRNRFETKIFNQLKRSKVSFNYEAEKIAYVWAGHYTPDFVLSTPSGKVYIETKGYFRPEDKRKLVSVKRCNPQLDIRILFYAHKEQYIKWANKNRFKWAVETIPREWIDGF